MCVCVRGVYVCVLGQKSLDYVTRCWLLVVTGPSAVCSAVTTRPFALTWLCNRTGWIYKKNEKKTTDHPALKKKCGKAPQQIPDDALSRLNGFFSLFFIGKKRLLFCHGKSPSAATVTCRVLSWKSLLRSHKMSVLMFNMIAMLFLWQYITVT